MVKKIYFPREVLPVSYVCSCFMNMLFCFIIIFLVVGISGVGISLPALFCLPYVFAVEFIMCLGMAFLTSSITVYFRDLEHIMSIVTMMWMYLTPILYSMETIPEKLRPLYYFNPMTPVVEAYRDILYYTRVPRISTLSFALVVGLVLLIVGYLVFARLKRHFVEEL